MARYDRIHDWTCDFAPEAWGPIEDERGFECRRWVSDSRAASAQRLRFVASQGGLAFVGGVLQQRSEGPCWVVRRDVRGAEGFRVQVDALPELGAVNDYTMLYAYAVSRRADARATAMEYARAVNRPFHAEGINTCFIDPRAPAQNDQDRALLAAARQTESMMTEIVGKLPVHGIRRYADLKDAIRIAASAPGEPFAETLLPVLRDVDAIWADHVGVRRVGSARNPLHVFELRGVGDRAAAHIPEIDVADLEALGNLGGRVPGRL